MRIRMQALPAILVLFLAAIPLLAQPAPRAAKKPLRLEEIFSETGLTGRMPTQMRWSPDGRLLTYILQADEGDRRDLWVVDVSPGEKRILVSYDQLRQLAPPPEQATTDERERERLRRYAVAAYLWSPDSKSILFTSVGQLYLFDLAAGSARLLTPGKKGVGDPKFSPDGTWVSFVYQHDIWLVPVAGLPRPSPQGEVAGLPRPSPQGEVAGLPRRSPQGEVAGGPEKQLTRGGSENILHGDLDWVYPEEFGLRTGYHWSPDSRRIAFLELDEYPVPTHPIADLVPLQARVDFQRYPKAGDPNPKVRVGMVEVDAPGTQTIWFDRAAEYIPRINWVDASRLAVQLLNRAQTELELVIADASTGRSRSVLIERDPHWLNITDDLTFLPAAEEFVWTSERTGFRHLYLYALDGRLKRALTEGEWEVRGLAGIDKQAGWVYYTSTERNPMGSDLYRVKLDPARRDPELLTQARGTHAIALNPSATAYLDTYSALATLPQLSVYDLATGRTIPVDSARTVEDFDLVEPELLALAAPDGALVRGMLLKPRVLAPGRRYPVLVHIYGGPHAPTIRDAWGGTNYLFHQFLVQEGFVVFYVDDRASSIPGHKYEVALYRNYGPTALADLRVAIDHLRRLAFVDPARIALWGWSGGGFSTCFALTHSDLFKVGIAGAPVTDWRLYDSIYTERYLGLPQEEPEAYRRTSAVEAAANLQGRLLLVHGTADDNVHIQNTEQLIHALIEAGKPFDLLVYPQKTHSIQGPKVRLHLFRSFTDYLKKHL